MTSSSHEHKWCVLSRTVCVIDCLYSCCTPYFHITCSIVPLIQRTEKKITLVPVHHLTSRPFLGLFGACQWDSDKVLSHEDNFWKLERTISALSSFPLKWKKVTYCWLKVFPWFKLFRYHFLTYKRQFCFPDTVESTSLLFFFGCFLFVWKYEVPLLLLPLHDSTKFFPPFSSGLTLETRHAALPFPSNNKIWMHTVWRQRNKNL